MFSRPIAMLSRGGKKAAKNMTAGKSARPERGRHPELRPGNGRPSDCQSDARRNPGTEPSIPPWPVDTSSNAWTQLVINTHQLVNWYQVISTSESTFIR